MDYSIDSNGTPSATCLHHRNRSRNNTATSYAFTRPGCLSAIHGFQSRHPNLQTIVSYGIESAQVKEVSSEAIVNFLAVFLRNTTSRRRMYTIWMRPVHQFVISLTIGFPLGTSQARDFVVDSALRRKFQAQPGRHEWVAVIECICADGSMIAPMVIFKGRNLMTSWISRTAPKD